MIKINKNESKINRNIFHLTPYSPFFRPINKKKMRISIFTQIFRWKKSLQNIFGEKTKEKQKNLLQFLSLPVSSFTSWNSKVD